MILYISYPNCCTVVKIRLILFCMIWTVYYILVECVWMLLLTVCLLWVPRWRNKTLEVFLLRLTFGFHLCTVLVWAFKMCVSQPVNEMVPKNPSTEIFSRFFSIKNEDRHGACAVLELWSPVWCAVIYTIFTLEITYSTFLVRTVTFYLTHLYI